MCVCKQKKEDSLVYLFNSAFRGTYAVNVFKIMASQSGLYVKMRYSIKKNVPLELREEKNYSKLVSHQCFIIFINRYNNNNYEYLPIRKGVIKRIHAESGYLFIDVQLGDFISASGEASEFSTFLLSKLKDKNIPMLKDSNPEITTDGNYIVECDENIDEAIQSTEDSWLACVEYISRTKALSESYTFVKLRLCEVTEGDVHTQINPDKKGIISISPSSSYVIEATYFDPTLGKGKSSLSLNFQNPLVGMQQKIFCTSKIDNVSIPISSGKNVSLHDKACAIELSQVGDNAEHCILTVPCKINPIWKNSVVILLIIMIFVLAFGSELAQSKDFYLALWVALKWLISLILVVYAGVRVF